MKAGSNRCKNWSNFGNQSGNWQGRWVRYDLNSLAVTSQFNARRELPMLSDWYMKHTNYYENPDTHEWSTRAFRGYGFERNCLSSGIIHSDFPQSRGLFTSMGMGAWSNLESPGAEVYFVTGDIRFSLVISCQPDGRPVALTYIREMRQNSEAPSPWSLETELRRSDELPFKTLVGRYECVFAESLCYFSGPRLWLQNQLIDGMSVLHLPDGVSVQASLPSVGKPESRLSVFWHKPEGNTSMVSVNYRRGQLLAVTSFVGREPRFTEG